MDSSSQQKNNSNKASVLSLLNPTNEVPTSQNSNNTTKRNFEVFPSEVEKPIESKANEKRKRVRMFGVELDVAYNENPKELLNTVQDQLELFTNNMYHVQSQQYYQQQEDYLKVLQTPTNNNTNNKATPSTLIDTQQQTEEYQRFLMEYFLHNQYIPGCNQLQPVSQLTTTNNNTNPCALPSILNPPMTHSSSTFTNLQSFSLPPLPSSISGFSPHEQLEQPLLKKSPTSPPYSTNPGHKYRTVIIQPSSQDPPIEARVIIDDPKTNPFTQQWMEHFQELKAFKEQFGHTNVTRSITGYYNLGNWVAEQRRKFKQGKVTESQFNCLNQIGFEWDRSYYFFRTRHKKRNSMEGSSDDRESPRTD